MYKPRHAEKTVARLAKNFGAVLVTGARQVGKTTLLKEFGRGLSPELQYVKRILSVMYGIWPRLATSGSLCNS